MNGDLIVGTTGTIDGRPDTGLGEVTRAQTFESGRLVDEAIGSAHNRIATQGSDRSAPHAASLQVRESVDRAISAARKNPLTAISALGAVAAGVFLWSRRNQVSDRITNLADQISDWRSETASSGGFLVGARRNDDGRTQAQIAEEALTLKETGQSARFSPS